MIRSPSATTTACSTPSTASRRAARPSSSRRGFAWPRRSSNSRPRRTRRGSPSSKRKLKAAEAEAKLATDSAFEGWRLGIFADGKPAEGKGLPDALASILRKPEGDRSDEEKQTLDAGLRKHFDDKVRPALAAKLPALVEARRRQETAQRLPRPIKSRAS